MSTTTLWRTLAAGVAAAALLLGAGAARGAAATDWFWSPGLCKYQLHQFGVEFDDGRTFSVQQAFCIGRGGPETCIWNEAHTRRLYSRFYVIARSYDSNVRVFNLRVSGKNNWRGSGTRLFGRMGSTRFVRFAGPRAASVARAENDKGCAP